ncbi:MAG: domain S-box protein [Firmicutes bacterium]|nr:domain S-box protein [Bacillota bacterium]
MKRNRVYLPEQPNLQRLPDDEYIIKRLLSILESSFDGIFVTDSKAVPTWVNRSYEVISGLTAADVVGVPMEKLVETGIVSQSATLMAMESGSPITIEQTFRTGRRAVVTSTPIFDWDDNIAMVVTNVRDISELTALQETLEKHRKINERYETEISVIRQQLLRSPEFVAEDPAILDILRIVGRAALLDTVVLVQGETGVGKERIAAYIHQHSPRNQKNYIRVNCGAIPENLAESELFGYDRGAFTGANREGKLGLFEVADGGTIFLDEVGELSLNLQTKLLRVLQEKELTRVGGSKPIKVNVRVIAATNRDLKTAVEEGTFREDLFYRLSVFPVYVPPLRERKLDIPKLASNVIRELNQTYGKQKTISPATIAALLQYPWPGNVRELRNVMERAFIMSDETEITPNDLTLIRGGIDTPTGSDAKSTFQEQVDRFEAQVISRALRQENGLRAAARSLDMDPATLLRKKKKYQEKQLLQL